MGDVNTNCLLPDDSKEFKSITSFFGFKQMVKKPTRMTESTESLIDIIATNNLLNLSRSKPGLQLNKDVKTLMNARIGLEV